MVWVQQISCIANEPACSMRCYFRERLIEIYVRLKRKCMYILMKSIFLKEKSCHNDLRCETPDQFFFFFLIP